MSMNNSIMAGVARPMPVATAVRIPVLGPYNTLVIVHLRDAGVIPGIMWNNCKMSRHKLSYPSNFVLKGFDPTSPPDFQHSTTGWLSYLGTGDDATFTYALDAVVSARFDEVGRYWVDYSSAMLNDCEISAAACSLSSWVLVNEPRPETHAGRLSWATIGKALELGAHSGISLGAEGLRKLLQPRNCDCSH